MCLKIECQSQVGDREWLYRYLGTALDSKTLLIVAICVRYEEGYVRPLIHDKVFVIVPRPVARGISSDRVYQEERLKIEVMTVSTVHSLLREKYETYKRGGWMTPEEAEQAILDIARRHKASVVYMIDVSSIMPNGLWSIRQEY